MGLGFSNIQVVVPSQIRSTDLATYCSVVTVNNNDEVGDNHNDDDTGHEYFPGQCPNFTPMSEFDWDKFSTGVWYVTRKFSTKSSCLTYEFKTDDKDSNLWSK